MLKKKAMLKKKQHKVVTENNEYHINDKKPVHALEWTNNKKEIYE